MNTNTTSGAADMLELIEAYAEARHRQGHSSYNAKTAAALQAVKAALAAGQATAAQQGAAYAALPDEGEPWRGHKFKEVQRGCWRCDCGKTIKEVTSDQSTPASGGNYPVMPKRYTVDDDGEELFTAEKMRAFADATHTLRASHGQAPAGAAPACWIPPEREGEYHSNLTITAYREPMAGWEPLYRTHTAQAADSVPAVGVPLLDYAMQIAHERELRVTGSRHDEDGAKLRFEAAAMRHTATGAAQADSVQEEAARLDFMIDQGAYVVSDPDACTSYWLHWARPDGDTWVQIDKYPTPRAAIDSARKQGEKQ